MARRKQVPLVRRYADSKRIARHSLALIARERDLWLFPALAGLLLLAGMAAGVLLMTVGGLGADFSRYGMLVLLAVLFLPFTIATSCLQAAFSYALFERMEGRPATRRQALRRALSLLGPITRWNVLAGTAGLVIGMIGQLLEGLRGVPWLGRLVQTIGAFGWAAAAFFAVPVLVLEREPTALGTLRRSVAIGRAQWGKTVAGVVTIMLFVLVPYLAVAFVGMGILMLSFLAGYQMTLVYTGFGIVAFAIVAMLLSMPLVHAMQVAYQTVLYRFAVTGRVDAPFTAETVQGVWQPYREP